MSPSRSTAWPPPASPNPADAELSLVRDLHALKQRSEAIASLEGFLKAHPQPAPEFESWLGILLDESGQWPSGEAHHRKALETAPSRDFLHNNLGYNLLMQKKNAEAAAEFREALKLNPASQIARNNLGSALAAGDTAQAVASFQAASDPATAHNNLAAVLIENGNFPEARRELQLALSYNKAHSAALKNLELVSRLDGRDATLPAPPPGNALATLQDRFCPVLCTVRWTNRRRLRPKPLPPTSQRGTMKKFAIDFMRDEQGQDLVEYALIVAAVGLALITTVQQLSQAIVSLYQSMTGDLASIGTPAT